MRDGFTRHHGAHIRSARRVAYHSGTAAEQRYRPMSVLLHPRHGHYRNIVADVQTVGSGVESDVKRHFLLPQHFVQVVVVYCLFDKSALL